MNNSIVTEFLTSIRNIARLQQKYFKNIGLSFDLTGLDVSVISFLNNNPGKDCASDIVDLRGFSKGNVSISVENLERKGYLFVLPDELDKRKKHLRLSDKSYDVIKEIDNAFNELATLFLVDSSMIESYMSSFISAGEKARLLLGE